MHAPCELRKKPPAYAFQTFGGEGHGASRSELTTGLLLPHVIAARVRHAWGTLTVTDDRPARTTKPAFSQYGHCSPEMGTTCGMYARGTEITPRTRRYPSAKGDFGCRMIWSHVTTSGGTPVGVEIAAGCDEPPRHDADTAPASTTTTSMLTLNRTLEILRLSGSDGGHGDVRRVRRGDRGRIESFDDEPDAKRQLPHELRGCRNPWTVPPSSRTPSKTRIPVAHIRGPPTSPSMARRRGTRPDRYIR
jgi:hypothetical protein